MGHFQGYDGGAGDFQLGPLAFMLNYPDYCVLYRFTPRGMDRTDMELVWFVHGDAQEGRDYERDALNWLWDRTTRGGPDHHPPATARVCTRGSSSRARTTRNRNDCASSSFDWYLEALARLRSRQE